MTPARRALTGFTLVELVVVISIAAIVAVFMMFFLQAPVDVFVADRARADLVDSADRILRSVDADVRTALPNSLRQSAAGGVVALELLATSGVARYYAPGEKAYLGGAQEVKEELAIGSADPSFYTFDAFVPSAVGSYLAVNPQGAGTYAMAGVMTPFASIGAPVPPPAVVPGEAWVQLPAAGFNFATGSATHSVFLVSSPVSYLCDPAAGTLRRYSGYAPAAAQPTTNAQLLAAGAASSLIAQNVTACTTLSSVAAPASNKFNQLVVLNITLGANGGETLPVFHEAAVGYVP